MSGQTEDWRQFGMERKEHIAWISPMLATLAAFLVFYCGPITLVTGATWLRSGLRQGAFGIAAATVTFAVGRLLGTAVG